MCRSTWKASRHNYIQFSLINPYKHLFRRLAFESNSLFLAQIVLTAWSLLLLVVRCLAVLGVSTNLFPNFLTRRNQNSSVNLADFHIWKSFDYFYYISLDYYTYIEHFPFSKSSLRTVLVVLSSSGSPWSAACLLGGGCRHHQEG